MLRSSVSDTPKTVTRLIHRIAAGDPDAGQELWPLVYEELRGLAQGAMRREDVRATLQPTALVHEAWMRFERMEEFRLSERAQFFLLASKIMRSVLVDSARARKAQKRGGGEAPAPLTVDVGTDTGPDLDLLVLDEALTRLEERDPTLARLVELRFFAGLTHAECAEALATPLRTVERQWSLARTWLFAELTG